MPPAPGDSIPLPWRPPRPDSVVPAGGDQPRPAPAAAPVGPAVALPGGNDGNPSGVLAFFWTGEGGHYLAFCLRIGCIGICLLYFCGAWLDLRVLAAPVGPGVDLTNGQCGNPFRCVGVLLCLEEGGGYN